MSLITLLALIALGVFGSAALVALIVAARERDLAALLVGAYGLMVSGVALLILSATG